MINFYKYVHATLSKPPLDELIVLPGIGAEQGSRLTNKDLLQSISNYRYLLQNKVLSGESVLLAIPTSVHAINAILAVQSIGAIPVLPPPKTSIPILIAIIKAHKIKAVFADKGINLFIKLGLKSAGIKLLYPDEGINRSTTWEPILVSPEQSALVSYSSGTTGRPKSICRSHRILSAQHLLIKKIFPPLSMRRDLPLFPNIILHNLAAGITTILPDIPGFQLLKLNPKSIVAQLQNIDTLMGNVFYFKKIIAYLSRYPQSFLCVKQIKIGGSPVPENLVAELLQSFPDAACYIIYGSSEAEPISIRKVNLPVRNPINGFFVGTPVEELEIRINNTTEINTPDGLFNAGEIEVKGAHVAARERDGWLNTGDIGYLTDKKELYLTARIGNETPYHHIQHYQIEHLLMIQKGVDHVAAIPTSEGFDVFIQGTILHEEVWQILNTDFSPGMIKSVQFKTRIQVDNRHQSKILYHKINEI